MEAYFMKKILFTSFIALISVQMVRAETTVTLYGVVDAGVAYEKVSGTWEGVDYTGRKVGVIDAGQSGSRWGLKAVEDLGNGLKAVAQLESGFDIVTGQSKQGGRLFGRQSIMGLQKEKWGRLDFGRQTNIGNKFGKKIIDPLDSSYNQLAVGASFSSLNTVRYDNMIMYQSPKASGFQAGIGYSFAVNGKQDWEIDNENTDDKALTGGLRYAQGALDAFFAYDQVKLKAQDTTIKAWAVGMAYDFDVIELSLAFGRTIDGWFAGQNLGPFKTGTFVAANGLELNSYIVGMSAPLGAGKVRASWQMADPRSGATSSKTTAFVGDDLQKQQIFSFGYTYNLSKRTNLYAYGSYAKHVVFQDDLTSTLVSLGVHHKF